MSRVRTPEQFAHDWEMEASDSRALQMLAKSSAKRIAALNGERVLRVWGHCASYMPQEGLAVLAKLPPALQARISAEQELEAWRAIEWVESFGAAIQALPSLRPEARTQAEGYLLTSWGEDRDSRSMGYLKTLPDSVRARLTPERVAGVWRVHARGNPVRAIYDLREIPASLRSAITPEEVVAVVRRSSRELAGGEQWKDVMPPWIVATIPDDLCAGAVQDVMLDSWQTAVAPGSMDADGGFRTLRDSSPQMRARITADHVAEVWRREAGRWPIRAISLLKDVPDELLTGIDPAEVQDAFTAYLARTRNFNDSQVADLDVLSNIPPRLRPWADAQTVQDLWTQVRKDVGGMNTLRSLREMDPALRAHIPAEDVREVAHYPGSYDISHWMEQVAGEVKEGKQPRTEFAPELFVRWGELAPDDALSWLLKAPAPLRDAIPAEAVRETFAHLIARYPQDALRWWERLPHPQRPASLREEARRVVLALMGDIRHALWILRDLPDEVRPTLSRQDTQGSWEAMMRADPGRALQMREALPEELKPVLTRESLAHAMTCSDGRVRMEAIRLASELGRAPVVPEVEEKEWEPVVSNRGQMGFPF